MALSGALGLGLVARNARDAAALCVAGVEQSHIQLRFTWQAWYNLTSTFVLRGGRGTHGTGWRAWVRLVAQDAAALCVARVAQSHIYLRFAWHAWRNHTSTCVAGVPLMALSGALGLGLVARDAAALCVAGVAQSRIQLRFTWQAWHNLTSTFVFAWQAWHSWYWVARLGPLGRAGRCGTLRSKRGTISHPASFCVAGVAQSHIHLRFAWQAWHSWHSVARLGPLGRAGRLGTLRGRRSTISHPALFHVVGVAQLYIHLRFCVAGVARMALGGALGSAWSRGTSRHFAWQAWHSLPSTFVLRGRRGKIPYPPSFCVASVALMALGGALGSAWSRGTPRHFAWQAWHNLTSTFVLRGKRGTVSHPPWLCFRPASVAPFLHHFVTHHL